MDSRSFPSSISRQSAARQIMARYTTMDIAPTTHPSVTGTVNATPKVAVVIGSDSDAPVMRETLDVLAEFEVPTEFRVLSAHRTPDDTAAFGREAADRGIQVIVAAAGGAAHLAGVIAAMTTLPVIGVPMAQSALGGIDSLLSTVQMPGGIPVATVAIGGARNAALLALGILALSDKRLETVLTAYQDSLAAQTRGKDAALRSTVSQSGNNDSLVAR